MNDWFGPHVGPMAAVATYRSAPPRGMTNPPQNPKVRDQLIQELEEYGVGLEVKSWPPRAPDLKASFVFGRPSEPPNCRNPAAKLAQDLARKHMSWLRDGDTRLLANRGRPAEPPRPQSTGSLSASAGRGNTPSAPAPQPPKREPSPNKKLLAAPSAPEQVPQSKSRGASKMRPSSRTGSHRRRSNVTKEPSGQKDGELPKVKAKKVPRSVSDSDLHNAMRTLRSQGRLHRAAVGDRFRFGADLSEANVIKGAGATPMAPGIWASDMSELVTFHNKALRNHNPSQLELLPQEDPNKKKKKKKKEDDDEMATSERELYEADKSYRNIRKIRRAFYPDSFGREKTHKELVIEKVTSMISTPFIKHSNSPT